MLRVHRTPFLLAAIIALCSPQASAQVGGADTTVTVDILRVPEAPGFILLGGAPSAVERPGTVQALAVSLVSRATEGDLFDKFAIQVSPFWLGGIPNLDYADYERGAVGFEAIRRTLALSAATDNLDLGVPTPAVALGVRFSLSTGRIDREYEGYGARRDSAFASLARFNSDITSRHQEALRNDREHQRLDSLFKAAAANNDTSRMTVLAKQQQDRAIEVLRELKVEAKVDAISEIGSLPERRLGFVMDAAGGWAVVFPDRDFDDVETYRWGAWTTIGYAAQAGTALAVVRFLRERDATQSGMPGSALDLGTRLIWDASNGKLSFSGEGVYRLGLDDDAEDRYRVSTELTYAVSQNRNLSLTLGRDFEGETQGNVLALLRFIANFGSGLLTTGH